MAAVVDVGAENLHLAIDAGRGHGLLEQDGQRINLLAGGAAGHPHPDRVIGVPVLQERGKDRRAQRLERFGIAEELGDADEQLAEQQIGLVRSLSQALDVGGDGIDLQHLHAPLDAADQGILLVAGEVVADAAAQQGADRCADARASPRGWPVPPFAAADRAQLLADARSASPACASTATT